jgi:AcrR family transcriptional regulator
MSDSGSPARSAIRDAAHRLFADRGYAGVSVRAIAADAGVDPALVIRHFGTKQRLFLETMQVELPMLGTLDGPTEQLGERWMRALLDADDETRSIYLALLRASDVGDVRSQLHAAHERFVQELAAHLEGPDAARRARVGAAVVGGLLSSLWVVGDEELSALPRDELVRRFGLVLQAAIRPA